MSEAAFTNAGWQSADGLTLHYRDYPGRADRPPILCIPGLTRNARDFEALAERFAGDWRVLCVDLRGRGESDYAKDPSTYNPLQYVEDIAALFEQAGLDRVVAIGTSLGGLVTMLLALGGADRLAGALINDIGPDIEPEGLDRIKDYVGQGRSYPTWMHAAWALKETSAEIYPAFATADWLRFAKRLMCVGGSGRVVLDYDMKIAEPIMQSDDPVAFDMWPAWRALAGRPVALLRGELSDLLSVATFARMARELPGVDAVEVPGVGHPPTLEEPVSIAVLTRLLERVEQGA